MRHKIPTHGRNPLKKRSLKGLMTTPHTRTRCVTRVGCWAGLGKPVPGGTRQGAVRTPAAALAFALLSLALLARAEIIDRIAVSVGNRVITESDLNREIRVAAFLDGVKPDFSPAGKRATAERMVEQVLIRRELEISRYPVPSAAEVAPVLEAFKKERFPNDGEYQRALADYGIADQDVKDLLLWQRTLLLFIEVRFQSGRPGDRPGHSGLFRQGGEAGGGSRPPRPAHCARRLSRPDRADAHRPARRPGNEYLAQRGPQPHRDRVPRRGVPVTRRRIAWIAAGGLAGLALGGAVAAILVLRSAWFYEQVRERVVSTVETATGGRVEAGSFQFDWKRLRAEIGMFADPRHGAAPASLRSSAPEPSPWG